MAEMEGLADEAARLQRLEQEIAELKARLDAQARTLGSLAEGVSAALGRPAAPGAGAPVSPAESGLPRRHPPREAAPSPAPVAFPAPPPAPALSRDGRSLEVTLVGTWFARVGAVAILLGAGFAFKYAIDRGLIGPGARVIIGVLAGIAFILWGEWAYRRGWPLFAQAVSGGGIALVYLSLWAALQLYRLLPPGTTFILLMVVTAAGGALALVHDSLALAVLATFGGFLNPFLVSTGEPQPVPLYAYVLLLDLGVAALAFLRRWRLLDAVAFAGTLVLFAAGFAAASNPVAFAFATAFFLLFTAVATPGVIARRELTRPEDLALLVAVSAAYLGAGQAVIARGPDQYEGLFTLLLGAFHALAAAVLWSRRSTDRRLVETLALLSAALFVLAVAQELDGPAVATAWALEAAAFTAVAAWARLPGLWWAGAGAFGLSLSSLLLFEARLGAAYSPQRLVLSAESLALLAQIAVLSGAAVLLRRGGNPATASTATAVAVLANVLTVAWLSFEAKGHFDRHPAGQAFAFTLTAVWGLYAAGLLVAGVAVRSRWMRISSVALFALVVLKMAAYDLWLLPTGFRIIAFIGLGAVLLLCSLLYHRFRDLLLGEEGREPSLAA